MKEKTMETGDAGRLSDEELANVSGGGCGEQGAHVRLPGGTCPHCKAKEPTGYYKSSLVSHTAPVYYMENLDCCGGTMKLGHDEVTRLQKIY